MEKTIWTTEHQIPLYLNEKDKIIMKKLIQVVIEAIQDGKITIEEVVDIVKTILELFKKK